ncbi:MAG: putative 7-carboxy-7-deazaguanine synthase QueE [Fusobacterium mortiferum]|jgi:7-carboxy-7-deazaguanine synthase|uniref:putative 7-carboxy-7-deazaguanine synthase QueE n=1 Tax=Fusobacterium TaxID=848 RepID=UPI000E451CDE|nr:MULTISPECIES: putative 7-carboxy-7-deazaguanine synthase QueE [Fusobacterium]MCF2698619.1 putative 7-carboxy-7-deazaguanine synthase QueE [Fusobacterium mortiferum]MCI6382781.1 putative 7-carboxy-7-deazaguanine synthase QueE [Fusobacterium mortiferum]MCI7665756.1 putative 7-carboxy-7-deazaguanine synthase QueE [Fusobacterium mortiferum]MSS60892.1 putative 7-carboxy-7-deazaguanine synthase QueE [Fusobacterium sp. FSA-380-WT-2B]RGN00826.1 putative 7-carboxy-7-deazaguanine synthase QueE [Fusob
MANFKVVEIFESINGEGRRVGQLAIFIRLQKCNLNCSYCDTRWANGDDAPYTLMSEDEIYDRILKSGIKNITLTGGEPLLHKDVEILLEKIGENPNLSLEIETNGSIELEKFSKLKNPPLFTMDYKLPSSKMENKMCLDNFKYLTLKDTVKFVVGTIEDLKKAKEIIERYSLIGKCAVYFSPVFNSIDPIEIVKFMKENRLNGVNLQLQIHKFIWDPESKGV